MLIKVLRGSVAQSVSISMSFGQINNTLASFFTRPLVKMRFAFSNDIACGNN